MATKRAKKQAAEAVDKKGKDFLTEGEMNLRTRVQGFRVNRPEASVFGLAV